MGESRSVHDRLFCHHQHPGSVHVTQKLGLDQMSERSIRTPKDTKSYDKTHFLLDILARFTTVTVSPGDSSYDPGWMIVMYICDL